MATKSRGRGTSGGIRVGISAVGKGPVEDDGLRAVDRSDAHKSAIEACNATIPNYRIQVAQVVILIASTSAVLRTQTLDWQSLVRAVRVVAIGAISKAVTVGVRINIGSIQPYSGEESESCSAQYERSNLSTRRPTSCFERCCGTASIATAAPAKRRAD